MVKRFLLVSIILLSPVFADQIVLKNGDRATGKIVKKDGDSLTFKSDLMGTVTIKWADVAEAKSTEPVWVVLPSGDTVSGPIATSGGNIEVAAAAAPQTVPLPEVKALRDAAEQARFDRYLKPPLWDLWSGFFDLGFAAARGNSQATTLTTGFNAIRVTGHDTIKLYVNQIYARGLLNGVSTETANAIRGGWSYDRNTGRRLFLNVFNDYEHDVFQNLDLRYVAGGGLGVHVWKAERGLLDLLAGGDYQHASYAVPLTPAVNGSPAVTSRDSGELFWGDDVGLKLNHVTALKQSFRMFNDLAQTGEYRINGDLGVDTKMKKWLSWQITASDRYLTNPAPGRKTNDLLLTTGVRVSFAQ